MTSVASRDRNNDHTNTGRIVGYPPGGMMLSEM